MSTDVLERPRAPEPAVPTTTPVVRRPKRRVARRLALALVAYLVIGNLAILAATALARWQTEPPPGPAIASITNFRVVDADVWRGAAPGADGLADLAEAGAATIVDLRAEHDLDVDAGLIDDLGLQRVHLPVRDGQLPTAEQAREFMEIVEASPGPVYVHCGAGVGRSGAMAAFYLAASGQATGTEALAQNLAVGPPSLEQIVFAAKLDGGYDQPGTVITGLSRVLDAPRRIWHNLGG